MGQLGIWDGPHRAYDTSAAPAPRQAAAADSDAERANVALVENALSAFNAHDAVALAALYAPDAVLADQSAADDATGDAIAAAYKGLFASFPDAQKTEHVVWGAGDWVVSTYRLTGTNQGPLERLGLSEGSGKAIDLQVGDVIRVADGAIAEHWIFADGMAVGIQLGALQLPGM
jgi:ketosteroid isomerase-like protein